MDHLNEIRIAPGMRPLQVTATLATGLVHTAPWGIALDGLLASQLWSKTKQRLRSQGQEPVDVIDLPQPSELDLPLARCTLGTPDWHWAATCSHPQPSPPGTDVHYWTATFDHAYDQEVTTDARTVSDRQGRYRAHRMPLITTICAEVTWRALGNLETIADLLTPLASIGKKRSSGNGQVRRWHITPIDATAFNAAHLHPDGTLGRPTPARCVPAHVDSLATGTAGLRPPYHHPARQHELVLPATATGAGE